jgi:LCP family protein required for cell wall assembly
MSTKTILILIAIFALAGIILLMVACEEGLLTPQDAQRNLEPLKNTTENLSNQGKFSDDTQKDDGAGVEQEKEAEPLTVGKPYSQKLVEDGSKNILIIGQDKADNLYDTIGIVSIDKKSKTVRLIMIPRDTYIEYNQEILSKMEELGILHAAGIHKINSTHKIGSMIGYEGRFKSGAISFLADVIEEKFTLELDDYVMVNVKGFRELVDHLGGVKIRVPYDMDYDDPLQDLHIHIPKGEQLLDGYNAEGFVRFRQGYKEDGTFFNIGDTGRKKNQLNFLQQLIKQKGTISNINKIPGIIKILGKNVEHSIGLGDVLGTYMSIATDVITDKYEITSINIDSEKSTRVDGASYLVLE